MLVRGLRSITVVLAAAGAMALPAAAANARVPIAHAAGTCHTPSSGKGFGYTYLTWLWVFRTSCSTGTSVAKHHGKVRGWRCTTTRLDTSPIEYHARETCHSGSREIVWKFTQNT